jgi:hypothetical protein
MPLAVLAVITVLVAIVTPFLWMGASASQSLGHYRLVALIPLGFVGIAWVPVIFALLDNRRR